MNRKILYAVGDRLLRYVYKNPRRNLVTVSYTHLTLPTT